MDLPRTTAPRWVSPRILTLTAYLVCVCDVLFTSDVQAVGMTSNNVKTIKSTSITQATHVSQDPTWGLFLRRRRDIAMGNDLQKLLDLHNEFRRMEGAANMEHLIWNWQLAQMADLWAKNCWWGHGQPKYDNAPYEAIGQNLYATTGTLTMEAAMKAWYTEEKPYYNFNTGACAKTPCGHYTQVVWDTTREVGCAFTYCSNLRNVQGFNRGNYIVCNYGPAGNYIGQQPYIKGPPCSKCESGKFWCDAGLCRGDCTTTSACQCVARCRNGACSTSECGCRCQPGWVGPSCEDKCDDIHRFCGPFNGWPPSWCNNDHPYVVKGCPLMCGQCTLEGKGERISCADIPAPTLPVTAPPTRAPDGPNTGSPSWVPIVVPIVIIGLLIVLVVFLACCYYKRKGVPAFLSRLKVPSWLKLPRKSSRRTSPRQSTQPPRPAIIHETQPPSRPPITASSLRTPPVPPQKPLSAPSRAFPPPMSRSPVPPKPPPKPGSPVVPRSPVAPKPPPKPRSPVALRLPPMSRSQVPPNPPAKPRSPVALRPPPMSRTQVPPNPPPKPRSPVAMRPPANPRSLVAPTPPFKPATSKPPFKPKSEPSNTNNEPEIATVGGLVQKYVDKFQTQGYSY